LFHFNHHHFHFKNPFNNKKETYELFFFLKFLFSMDSKFIGKPPPVIIDLENMPERGSHHRRSHSDTTFRFAANFDDLLLFDPSDFDISNLPLPSPVSDAVPMTVDSDESNGKSTSAARHLRSLSVDSEFFDGLGFGGGGGGEKIEERKVNRHRHSNSMDGSSTTSFDVEENSMVMIDGVKKSMPPEKLAELALIDPKRAKRFIIILIIIITSIITFIF
jgi:hypothetical protein